jgi:hypothetical protein
MGEGAGLTSELLDLGECSLDGLWVLEFDELTTSVDQILRQIVKPRANLGGGGPPGRAD